MNLIYPDHANLIKTCERSEHASFFSPLALLSCKKALKFLKRKSIYERSEYNFSANKKIKKCFSQSLLFHLALFGFPKGSSPLVAEGKRKRLKLNIIKYKRMNLRTLSRKKGAKSFCFLPYILCTAKSRNKSNAFYTAF